MIECEALIAFQVIVSSKQGPDGQVTSKKGTPAFHKHVRCTYRVMNVTEGWTGMLNMSTNRVSVTYTVPV